MAPDIKILTDGVLEKGYLMSLAISDDNKPWVTDVIYVYDDAFNIYWMSDPDARHSQAIIKNEQVAGTVTVSQQGEKDLGIQFEGVASKIDGARHDLALKHYAKRKKIPPKETDDVLHGYSWYVLRPKTIELICEEHFGFTKQRLEL